MLPKSRRLRRGGIAAVVLALATVALLVSVPVPSKATAPVLARPALGSGTFTVTWNGVDVSSSSSSSSALSIDLTQSASLLFSWANGPPGLDINDARLQMYYLGFAVSTRDQILTSPTPSAQGSIPLDWTPVSVSYLLEGVYRLTASFIAVNGSTVWSENFYVRGTAPYGILAILPIVLLIIIVYEVYALVRSGRYAAIGKKEPETPPSTPPSSGPPSTTPPSGGAPPTTPPSESPPPASEPSGGEAADQPPASGGSS